MVLHCDYRPVIIRLLAQTRRRVEGLLDVTFVVPRQRLYFCEQAEVLTVRLCSARADVLNPRRPWRLWLSKQRWIGRLLKLPRFGPVSFGTRFSCHLCSALFLVSVQDFVLALALCGQFCRLVSGILLLLLFLFVLFPLLLGVTLDLISTNCYGGNTRVTSFIRDCISLVIPSRMSVYRHITIY